jgi:hypothetical protein
VTTSLQRQSCCSPPANWRWKRVRRDVPVLGAELSYCVRTVIFMRRSAPLALRLSHALRERDLRVDPRRLEGWCSQGLGADETLPLHRQIAHYAEVATLATSGTDADVTARRMAARGFACKRLRAAIMRGFGIPIEPSPFSPLDLSIGPSGDAGFAQLEQFAAWLASADTVGAPPLMVRVVRALQANARAHAEHLGEPPEAVFHSYIVSTMCLFFGADMYNGEATAAVLDIDPATFSEEALDEINTSFRMSPIDLEEAYRSAPIEDITAMATILAQSAPTALAHIGVTKVALDEIEDLAAAFAPCGVYFAQLFNDTRDSLPPLLPSDVDAMQHLQIETGTAETA